MSKLKKNNTKVVSGGNLGNTMRQVFAEVFADLANPMVLLDNPPPRNSFTAEYYVAERRRNGDQIAPRTAHDHLQKLVDSGKLGKKKVGNRNYYWRLKQSGSKGLK